jgi:hypothetical protein
MKVLVIWLPFTGIRFMFEIWNVSLFSLESVNGWMFSKLLLSYESRRSRSIVVSSCLPKERYFQWSRMIQMRYTQFKVYFLRCFAQIFWSLNWGASYYCE